MNEERPLNLLIVDDEALARRGLCRALTGLAGVGTITEAASVREAVAAVQAQPMDLAFLDIEMPMANGFEFFRLLPVREQPAVVIVTAYPQHTLRAFSAHAFDYLLKPVEPQRVEQALVDLRSTRRRLYEQLREQQSAAPDQHRSSLLLPDREGFLAVDTDAIEWIGAAENYVEVHVAGRVHLWRKTMVETERLLPPEHFMRIHRRFIVNIHHAVRVRPAGRGRFALTLTSGTTLVSGAGFREAVQNWVRP